MYGARNQLAGIKRTFNKIYHATIGMSTSKLEMRVYKCHASSTLHLF